MSNIYYVYAYLRKSNNTPYYVGKGKNTRAWDRHKGIGVPTDKSKIIIIESNLSEIGALALERRMIRWYGRKDIGSGILINKTDGGDGLSSPSDETRAKISTSKKGKYAGTENSFYGKSHSNGTKRKMSEAKMGKKFGPMSNDRKKKIGEANSGKIRSPEIKEKLSLAKKGKGWSDSRRLACRKIVTPMGVFNSAAEAERALGLGANVIAYRIKTQPDKYCILSRNKIDGTETNNE
jgi:hypothetical protein